MGEKTKTTIILIRHGETDWNFAGRWQGSTDIPLNASGRGQARALAARMTPWPIDMIYSSDLSRASETAQTLGRALNMKPVLDEGWRERALGELEGMTKGEVQNQYPDIVVSRMFIEAPGGETYSQVKDRVVAAFDRIMQNHHGQTTVVVSHSGTLRVLISYVLELPEKIYAPFSLNGNTGVSRIVIEDGGHAQLTLLNDCSHING